MGRRSSVLHFIRRTSHAEKEENKKKMKKKRTKKKRKGARAQRGEVGRKRGRDRKGGGRETPFSHDRTRERGGGRETPSSHDWTYLVGTEPWHCLPPS